MTMAQLEERVLALEQTVARLVAKAEQPEPPVVNGTPAGPTEPAEDEILDGVEFDFVPDVPPTEVVILKARIVDIKPAPVELTLSDAEWESIAALLGEDDDAQ